ncbi:hypothetical protein OX90_09140 [Pseudomonas coronafaciens pv. porri]|uniref:Immunity protein n=1 Tax=Pseudomonas coronafaciens pv. porri TaxID=83964 RepID=A0ABR5JR84_9PSED|nr:hypothetical protein [Pseudomonas coronafaciens]KOP51122.1 hypothetical protein OX88_26335 [Pseudomonas coronafaciens pv. porri]KOP59866.1 hypothetical protein OX90_09140 [Pseudomonas coronafaciens pv. porri]KPY21928.1 Uncharacterized protein ALO89_01123 [Pseudomonas coronafaciens pv. porri]RMU82792.1 hypothetical protein ALP22_02116 [Pseudomonas coronafaciens pv. porri]RMW12530.1 hypothetical protein ALO99_02777 [Pseudomonas coronafaciens pv. porri]
MKLTRTQQAYFEKYTKDLITLALQDSSPEVNTDYLISLIDFKDFGKRFGEVVLDKCSYTDLKAADKAYSDPAVIRATIAIEDAIATIVPSADDLKNVQFMAGVLTSGAFKGDQMINAIEDARPEIQEQAIKNLTAKA